MKKLLIISTLFILLISCRTAKKEWVKENYAEKSELTQLEQNISNLSNSLKNEISETLILDFTEKLKQATESSSENENETTIVSGSVEAEEGKEKTATIGDTKISTNGFNISFEIEKNREIKKEFESYRADNEIFKRETLDRIESLVSDIKEKNLKITQLENDIKTIAESRSKEVKKSGFGTWIYLIGFLVVILAIGYFYVKNKLKWFT